MNLSEIIDIVIGVWGFPYEEIAVKQANLVELLLVNPIIDNHLRVPTLSGNEAIALDNGDVFVPSSARRGFRVVLDVEVLLVVDLLELLLVHVVVVGSGPVGVSIVHAGQEWVLARWWSEERGGNDGAFEEERWWGVEEEGGAWGGECGEFIWW